MLIKIQPKRARCCFEKRLQWPWHPWSHLSWWCWESLVHLSHFEVSLSVTVLWFSLNSLPSASSSSLLTGPACVQPSRGDPLLPRMLSTWLMGSIWEMRWKASPCLCDPRRWGTFHFCLSFLQSSSEPISTTCLCPLFSFSGFQLDLEHLGAVPFSGAILSGMSSLE